MALPPSELFSLEGRPVAGRPFLFPFRKEKTRRNRAKAKVPSQSADEANDRFCGLEAFMLDLFALVILAVIFSPFMLRFSSREDEL